MRRARRYLLIYHIALLLFAAAVLFYWLLLRKVDFPFRCLFAERMHLYCPGCGCTRALEALVHLDLAAALAANPMVLWLLATLVYYEAALWAAGRGRRVSALPAILFAYALLAFFLIRNLLLVCWGIDPLGDLIHYWR